MSQDQAGRPAPEVSDQVKRLMDRIGTPLGLTGEFTPTGPSSPTDEGRIRIAVVQEANGTLVMHLGRAVTWVGMTPDQALQLADALAEGARALKQRRQPPGQ